MRWRPAKKCHYLFLILNKTWSTATEIELNSFKHRTELKLKLRNVSARIFICLRVVPLQRSCAYVINHIMFKILISNFFFEFKVLSLMSSTILSLKFWSQIFFSSSKFSAAIYKNAFNPLILGRMPSNVRKPSSFFTNRSPKNVPTMHLCLDEGLGSAKRVGRTPLCNIWRIFSSKTVHQAMGIFFIQTTQE